jgi:hypothetical protein
MTACCAVARLMKRPAVTPAQAEKVAGCRAETLRKNSDLGIGAHRYQLSRQRFAYGASDFLEITDPPAQAG